MAESPMLSATTPVPPTPVEEKNKNAFIETVCKKIRATRKRLNKIQANEEAQKAGKALNADQLDSIKRKSEVETMLKELEELEKQMEAIELENQKAEKKAAKKRKQEEQRLAKQTQEKHEEHVNHIVELLYLAYLQHTESAALLTTPSPLLTLDDEDLSLLAGMRELVLPGFDQEKGLPQTAAEIATHLIKLTGAIEEAFLGEVPYNHVSSVLDKIRNSRVFNPNAPLPEPEKPAEPEPEETLQDDHYVVVEHADVADAIIDPILAAHYYQADGAVLNFMSESELERAEEQPADASPALNGTSTPATDSETASPMLGSADTTPTAAAAPSSSSEKQRDEDVDSEGYRMPRPPRRTASAPRGGRGGHRGGHHHHAHGGRKNTEGGASSAPATPSSAAAPSTPGGQQQQQRPPRGEGQLPRGGGSRRGRGGRSQGAAAAPAQAAPVAAAN